MKYTINGKEYQEFDINKRCADLMGFEVLDEFTLAATQHKSYRKATLNNCWIATGNNSASVSSAKYNPYNNPSDTDAIIDKVWDELIEPIFITKDGFEWYQARWNLIMERHNCSKLIAACIWLIELND
jgi:hypothetical protein